MSRVLISGFLLYCIIYYRILGFIFHRVNSSDNLSISVRVCRFLDCIHYFGLYFSRTDIFSNLFGLFMNSVFISASTVFQLCFIILLRNKNVCCHSKKCRILIKLYKMWLLSGWLVIAGFIVSVSALSNFCLRTQL